MRPAELTLLLSLACAPPPGEEPAPDALEALAPPVFEARVETNIAELERRVAVADAERAVSGREPEQGELASLVEMWLSSSGIMRKIPLEEAGLLGDSALAELVAMSRDEALDGETRNGALHLAFAISSPASLEAVVEVLESAPEAWRRRYAAWLLGQTEDDRFLLRMLLVLRYEKDVETVCWLAEALAMHGNQSGLEALEKAIAWGGEAAQLAQARRAQLVDAAVARGVEIGNAAELDALWRSPDAQHVFDHEPSDALCLAAWRELAELSSERFQLRGVDDARFALCRTGPWGARLVAEALVDRDDYVRLHAAQVLERMAGRARPVADALHPLLLDPRTGHAVAEALGAIGADESGPLLVAALGERHPHELRVGAARGLGRLAAASFTPELRRIVQADSTPDDLRRTVAEALVRCTDDRGAARLLVAGMRDRFGDPQGCELALGEWIAREAAAGVAGFGELQDEWASREGPPPLLREPQDTLDRIGARAALVGEFLDSNPSD